MQYASLQDLGAQPAAMTEPVLDALRGQRLKMVARLAQADAAQDHIANLKRLSDEMVQRHAARHQVAAALARLKRDLALAAQRLDRLGLDQRHLPIRMAGLAERPFLPAIAIAEQSLAGDRLDFLDLSQVRALPLANINSFQPTLEHWLSFSLIQPTPGRAFALAKTTLRLAASVD